MDRGSNDCKQVYFEYLPRKRRILHAFNGRPGGEPFGAARSARQDERRAQLRGPSRSTAQAMGGAVPGVEREAKQTCLLSSFSKFDLSVAANLFKTVFFFLEPSFPLIRNWKVTGVPSGGFTPHWALPMHALSSNPCLYPTLPPEKVV